MSHSLEHFQNYQIQKILDDIYNMTEIGGVFFIEVPNENFKDHSIRINKDPHLSFFTVKSFEKLIEKSKFEILFIGEAGTKTDELGKIHEKGAFKSKLRKFKLIFKSLKFLNSLIILLKKMLGNIYQIFSNSHSVLKSE